MYIKKHNYNQEIVIRIYVRMLSSHDIVGVGSDSLVHFNKSASD